MKKTAFILAALLLLSLLVFPASAEGKARFYLTGDTTAKVGDTVKVTLHIDGEFSAHIINVSVYFDNTSLRYVGKTYKDAYRAAAELGGFPISDINQDGNAIAVGLMMLTDPATEPGEFVEFTFEVISTASPEAPFSILVDQFAYMPIGSTQGDPIDFTVEGFTIRISGGSGTGTTPAPTERSGEGRKTTSPIATPGPVNPTATTAPGVTPDPNSGKTTDVPEGTTDPNAGRATEAPEGTPDPNATGDPLRTPDPSESVPEPTRDPDGKENPSEHPDSAKDHFTPDPGSGNGNGAQRALKAGLIIGGSLLAAALGALVIMLILRKSKEK